MLSSWRGLPICVLFHLNQPMKSHGQEPNGQAAKNRPSQYRYTMMDRISLHMLSLL